MKAIQKRLYTSTVAQALPRPPPTASSQKRKLYTSPGPSFFDSTASATPPPVPTRSPSASHTRLTGESNTGKPATVEFDAQGVEAPQGVGKDSSGGGEAGSGGEGTGTQHQHNPPFETLALSSPATPGSGSGSGSGGGGGVGGALSHHHHHHNSSPYGNFAYTTTTTTLTSSSSSSRSHAPQPQQKRAKRPKLRYHLDVGAYGIPKRCRPSSSGSSTPLHHHRRNIYTSSSSSAYDADLSLATQIGEDAYFIRDNAMGVADGVGGWARLGSANGVGAGPTPSALFARRLMHFCSKEVEGLTRDVQNEKTKFSFSGSSMVPRKSTSPPSSSTHNPWYWAPTPPSSSPSPPLQFKFHQPPIDPDPVADEDIDTDIELSQEEYERFLMAEELEEELEELEEGIDVLRILESAYEQSVKAHVVPVVVEETVPKSTGAAGMAPLLSGSSTALVAVLDHVPCSSTSSSSSGSSSRISSQPPSSSSPIITTTASSPVKITNYAAGITGDLAIPLPNPISINTRPDTTTTTTTITSSPPTRTSSTTTPPTSTTKTTSSTTTPHPPSPPPPPPSTSTSTSTTNHTPSPSSDLSTYDAIIRIAHVGDCMGMLVRGEEIVWRTEEMWWEFNTPVQLGPTTPHITPHTTAHQCIVPVMQDDILILASDGMSDNLWDEDVLDEVARFRRAASASSAANTNSTDSNSTNTNTRTLAAMLSEALCSRARRVAETTTTKNTSSSRNKNMRAKASSNADVSMPPALPPPAHAVDDLELEGEVPFARRAREVGRVFRGGKNDDISVIVAVITPAESQEELELENGGDGRGVD